MNVGSNEDITQQDLNNVEAVQTVPDSIQRYMNDQQIYSAWTIVLLSCLIGVVLLEVFLDRWKF